MERTRLYHGLMAILRNENWVIISPSFNEVLRIPKDEIENVDIFSQLQEINFFKPNVVDDAKPEVSLVTLITTSNCNLCCKYCLVSSGESAIIMSDEIAFSAIDRAISNAFGKKLSVAFFGGEPTLTPELIKKVVDYARKSIRNEGVMGVEFSITTNGTLSEKLSKFLIDNDFLITLSADGPAIIQNYQRPFKGGGESSGKVDATIKFLADNNMDFKIRTTVTKYSVNYMAETVKWLHSLGGKKIQFEPISIVGRASKQEPYSWISRPTVDDFVENLKRAIIVGGELGVGVVNSSFMNIADPPRKFCDGNVDSRFAISYAGDITTCVEVQEKNHPAANNFIFGCYNSALKKIVTSTNKVDSPCSAFSQSTRIKECGSCFAQTICGGGCPVRNFHTTGEISTVDPYRCQVIKEIIPFIIGLFDEATYGS